MSNDKLRDAVRAAIYGNTGSNTADMRSEILYRRLGTIGAQIESLHNIQQHSQIIALCDQAISITQSLKDDAGIARFKAKKAQHLSNELGIEYHQLFMLNLTPGWFAFATDHEQDEYEETSQRVDVLNEEIDHLISDAVALAEKNTNKAVLSAVLICRGNIASHRFLLYKMPLLKGFRAKIWVNFSSFRNYFVEFLLFFPTGDFFKIEKRINAYKKDFILAANMTMDTTPINAAYAYFNLANNLRSAIRLRSAKKYLQKAKSIAISINDDNLLDQIQNLEGIIKEKGAEPSEEYIR